MKSYKLALFVATALLASIGLWVVIKTLQIRAGAVLQPVQMKLGDFRGNSLGLTLTVPEGTQFAFVLGLPPASSLPHDFEGVITVRQDSVVYRESFSSDDLKECNWLDQDGLQGYILTWHNDPNRLDSALQVGKSYTVFCEVKPQATAPMSLWIAYLQNLQAYRRDH